MGRSELTKKIPSLLCLLSIVLCCSKIFAQEIPRTPDGRPDFQGNWNNLHQTPLQRPASLGDKQSYTAEEADALVNQAEQGITERASPLNPDRLPPAAGSRVTNHADDDFDEFPIGIARINGEYRTSLVIDPQTAEFRLEKNQSAKIFSPPCSLLAAI